MLESEKKNNSAKFYVTLQIRSIFPKPVMRMP